MQGATAGEFWCGVLIASKSGVLCVQAERAGELQNDKVCVIDETELRLYWKRIALYWK